MTLGWSTSLTLVCSCRHEQVSGCQALAPTKGVQDAMMAVALTIGCQQLGTVRWSSAALKLNGALHERHINHHAWIRELKRIAGFRVLSCKRHGG